MLKALDHLAALWLRRRYCPHERIVWEQPRFNGNNWTAHGTRLCIVPGSSWAWTVSTSIAASTREGIEQEMRHFDSEIHAQTRGVLA